MGKQKKQAPSAAGGASTESEVSVSFTVPFFRYEGQVYESATVEKLADAGDSKSLELIAKLVQMKSGVVTTEKGDHE
jgi:hypothetical protein